MNEAGELKMYSPAEERVNVVSHALGLVLSVLGVTFMLIRAATYGTAWHVVSAAVFGIGLIALYTASTAYHHSSRPELRKKLRIADHAAIYLLIAGTYTPFCLIVLGGMTGWTIFAVSWGLATIGITLKLFFTGRFHLLSTMMYVLMGWVVIFAIKPLVNNLSSEGLFWLFLGGVCYTTGAIVYSIKKIKFNHAIFHVFVLAGSICHFISVYFYVLPTSR